MTKAQAARRINRAFKEYGRILAETLNEILEDADMWYGDVNSMERSLGHRNGGNLAVDGPFLDFSGDTLSEFLHTRKELGIPAERKRSTWNNSGEPSGAKTFHVEQFQGKPSRETLKRKTRYNRHSRPVPA